MQWAFAGYSLLIVAVVVALSLIAWSWLGVYKATPPPVIDDSDVEGPAPMSETTPLKLGQGSTRT
jgi:hypothetical protein